MGGACVSDPNTVYSTQGAKQLHRNMEVDIASLRTSKISLIEGMRHIKKVDYIVWSWELEIGTHFYAGAKTRTHFVVLTQVSSSNSIGLCVCLCVCMHVYSGTEQHVYVM